VDEEYDQRWLVGVYIHIYLEVPQPWLRYSAVCGEIKIDVPALTLALPLNGGNMIHGRCAKAGTEDSSCRL
jgi:hypothetical protein